MVPYVQLALFALLVLLLLSRSSRRWVKALVLALLYPVLVLQSFSVGLTGNLVDYRFIFHMNSDALQYASLFWSRTAVFAALAVGGAVALVKLSTSRWLENLDGKWASSLAALTFALLFVPGGMGTTALGVARIVGVRPVSFPRALERIGIDSASYVDADNVAAHPGKNIVVISMESLERGFITGDGLAADLTPNLRRLRREWTFFPHMPQIPGTGWTAASMYAVQTGLPAFFSGHQNDLFQHALDARLLGLGQVLTRAGYTCLYIMARPEFAGERDILNLYGFQVVSERNCLGHYPEAPTRLYDMDVFNEARLQLQRLTSDDRPFALFISTGDSHFPDGIHDPRMEAVVGRSRKGLLFSVSALDSLVAGFVSSLGQQGLLQRTAVYLFPDHLLMGGSKDVISTLDRDGRGLYLLTNVAPAALPRETTDTISQLDLPRIILDGSAIRSNARFLTDYLEGADPVAFIRRHTGDLAALNTASLRRVDFRDGIELSIDGHTVQLVSGGYRVPLDLNPAARVNVIDVVLTPRMEFVGAAGIPPGTAFDARRWDEERLHLIVRARTGSQDEDEEISAYLGDKQRAGLLVSGVARVRIPPRAIQWVVRGGRDGDVSGTLGDPPGAPDGTLFRGAVDVTSSGRGGPFERPSLVRYQGALHRLRRGLSILSLQDGQLRDETFDTDNLPVDAVRFVGRVKSLVVAHRSFVVVADRSVMGQLPFRKQELASLGLQKLSSLDTGQPYIAYARAGRIGFELTSDRSSTVRCVLQSLGSETLGAPAPAVHSPRVPRSSSVEQWKHDTSRYIAHAGGAIGSDRYTNSMEALDASYARGFRLFELDIGETSDGCLVAVHDWPTWARRCPDYHGPVPPTRAAFKKHKILGRYLPLDMADINAWFERHPDAVLVTDKINKPALFSSQFVDPRRLMMELFTMDAVREGLAHGVVVMPNMEKVVSTMGDHRVQQLKDRGITYVTASRRLISGNADLFRELKEAGIRVYVFHVNYDPGKDEEYVVNNEFGLVYGMYADHWSFD